MNTADDPLNEDLDCKTSYLNIHLNIKNKNGGSRQGNILKLKSNKL